MNLLALLDELRSIGQNGLRYTDDPHHERRYGRILELVSRYYGETFDVDPTVVSERFCEELKRGHVTPRPEYGADITSPLLCGRATGENLDDVQVAIDRAEVYDTVVPIMYHDIGENDDWSRKPAHDVYTDLVFDQWWTDETGVTDSDGSYRMDAFLGVRTPRPWGGSDGDEVGLSRRPDDHTNRNSHTVNPRLRVDRNPPDTRLIAPRQVHHYAYTPLFTKRFGIHG